MFLINTTNAFLGECDNAAEVSERADLHGLARCASFTQHSFSVSLVFLPAYCRSGSRISKTKGHRLADVYCDFTVIKCDITITFPLMLCIQMFNQLLEYC